MIITDRTKDRLVDIVLRQDNTEEFAKLARGKLNYFYENLVFSSLDLGVKEGKALDLGTQFGLCALNLAKQRYDFDITCFQDGPKSLAVSKKFAEEDMVDDRIKWITGRQEALPFADHSFDLVISGFDMHHWENPVIVLNEIERITKTNGVLLIADLRRDAFSPVAPMLKTLSYLTKKNRIYDELKRSYASSYLKSEVLELLKNSGLRDAKVMKDLQSVYIARERKGKKHVVVEFMRP
jgi:ubiquinone/menaquinone biosynthesis C-methylase UbiE